MFLLFLSILFFICLIFIFYKYNHFVIKTLSGNQTKNKYDLIAHKNMKCNVIKKIQRHDLGNGINLLIVPNSCYDALPHTIDENNIVIPMSLFEKGGIEMEKVIDHELIHIMQRRDNNSWKQLYNSYKWKIYNKFDFMKFFMNQTNLTSNIMIDLFETMRYNPDISYNPFAVWNNRYWFVSCYSNKINPKVNESKTFIYDLIEKKLIVDFPPEYYDWMKTNQADHPHEIFAELLSDSNKINNLDSKNKYRLKNFYFLQKEKLFEN